MRFLTVWYLDNSDEPKDAKVLKESFPLDGITKRGEGCWITNTTWIPAHRIIRIDVE